VPLAAKKNFGFSELINIMKLTKSKLQQIIKEELHNVLHEQLAPKEYKAWQKKQGQQKKAKATARGALINFFRSLSNMTHETMSAIWLQKLIKVAKKSIRKGDYGQALEDVAKTATMAKIPKLEILQNALEAIKSVDIELPTIDSTPARTSMTFD
jgi:hypothetical protein